jgi:hypothetical protein
MRILNLQNLVLVTLAVSGMAASSACSSSDAPGRDPDAAGASNSGAGAGNPTAGSGNPGAGASNPTAGSGNPGAGAGNPTAGAGGGISGTAGAGGAAAPSVCDGVGSRVLEATPEAAFIDDFEKEDVGGDATKPGGGWYGFNDVAPSGTNPIQPLRAAGGAVTTAFAGHYSGTGAKTPVAGGYGVGLEYNVGIAKDISQYCVDASAYQGVSFWAKAGGTNKTIAVGFVVPSQNQVKNGGDCPDDAPAANCNNYPQKNITLTDTWAQYTVDFVGPKGTKGATVVAGKVQQVLFLAPTADWDIWVDELAFYTGTPPAGAVAPPPAP